MQTVLGCIASGVQQVHVYNVCCVAFTCRNALSCQTHQIYSHPVAFCLCPVASRACKQVVWLWNHAISVMSKLVLLRKHQASKHRRSSLILPSSVTPVRMLRKGGWYDWKPSSSSSLSIRALRAQISQSELPISMLHWSPQEKASAITLEKATRELQDVDNPFPCLINTPDCFLPKRLLF